ncbi:hypothetical protein TcasGA2_TC009655 [Tribolium castaneum]|uniref:CHK kinase-like domain-containing protein n=1 Tax=Tribolium castaneum TaxID=7070 RepID=D6WTH1_TRICA|nr:PREDICTED: uncharacterized protein LOC663104 [Tribolium castaneum]EFA06724.1 hypothetical protein TcasGA2_TC009655 [Tribolium castaneum]|eukprot:XP_974258.1 PREDICTED: uncharacterized protein LOC663104 [Tribolium castaneum]
MSTKVEREVAHWLATALKSQNLSNFSVKLVGNSGKGDGFVGDVLFVHLSTPHQRHNLVLKCSKRSEALKKFPSIERIFINETFLYETLLPTFINFQKEKNLTEIFDSVPKFHGSYKSESVHVIVLEDLKKLGFELWPVTKPLNRDHIEFVICEYGKFHATSVALKTLQPEKFHELVDTIRENVDLVVHTSLKNLMTRIVHNSAELLQGELDQNLIQRFANLAEKTDQILRDLESEQRVRVVCHGDCWSNNFMYKYYGERRNVPAKVALIDWQIANYATPVSDLSYFLFSCLSEEDFEHLDDILSVYRLAFSNHLRDFGLDSEKLYPCEQFTDDWRTCSGFGLIMATMVTKASYIEKDEIVGIDEVAEQGKTLADSFLSEIRDKEGYRKRIGYLVKNAAKYGLI